MTLEEIIQGLYRGDSKAIKEAIKALEQQPSEDCVSRQAVVEYIKACGAELGHDCENEIVVEDILNMPPVTPTFPNGATNGDMIKAMFPNQTIGCAIPITDRNGAKFYRTAINGVTDFTADWWNAQYKRGDENV